MHRGSESPSSALGGHRHRTRSGYRESRGSSTAPNGASGSRTPRTPPPSDPQEQFRNQLTASMRTHDKRVKACCALLLAVHEWQRSGLSATSPSLGLPQLAQLKDRVLNAAHPLHDVNALWAEIGSTVPRQKNTIMAVVEHFVTIACPGKVVGALATERNSIRRSLSNNRGSDFDRVAATVFSRLETKL